MNTVTKTLTLCIAAMTAAPVAAQNASPQLSGEIAFELQDDWAYRSEDRSNENNDLYPTIEPSATLHLAPEWSVFAHAVLEPIGDPAQFENRRFEDLGLYMEELFVEYSGARLGGRAGKLNPGFGVAWDRAAGIYGTDFAEDYETSEQIGAVGSWRLAEGDSGNHTVSASTFFADTTLLSESALRGRGDTRRADGGPGNTESFESFLIAADGEDIPFAGAAGYHLSLMRRAAGAGDTDDETSVAAALFTAVDLGRGVTFAPLVEAVRRDNADGVTGVDTAYLVLSGSLGWNGWNLAVARTGRVTRRDGAADDHDSHFQVSAGYAFDFGLSLDVGWRIAEEADVETRTLGILAAWAVAF